MMRSCSVGGRIGELSAGITEVDFVDVDDSGIMFGWGIVDDGTVGAGGRDRAEG